MSWIDTTQYDPMDICPICQLKYGKKKAVYKTECNHVFHNDCLNDYCESQGGIIRCPICRTNLDYVCMDVWAFKEHALGENNDSYLFNGNRHVLSIYHRNHHGGSHMRKTRKRNQSRKQTRRRTLHRRTKK